MWTLRWFICHRTWFGILLLVGKVIFDQTQFWWRKFRIYVQSTEKLCAKLSELVNDNLKFLASHTLKSLGCINWYSSEWECDFLAQDWNWAKMIFIFNILTYQTIIEQNFNQKFDHVSKYGNLFCIFPLNKTFSWEIVNFWAKKLNSPKKAN